MAKKKEKKEAAQQQWQVSKNQSQKRGQAHQQQSSSTGGHRTLPQLNTPRADSLRALKQALSLRVGSHSGSLCAPLKPPMPDVTCKQVMDIQALSLGEIEESSSVQVPQQRGEDTLKCIKICRKRSRFSLSSDAEKKECREAHLTTPCHQQECDEAQKKHKMVDKYQSVSTIKKIKMQSEGLLKDSAPLQAEFVKVKFPDLEKMTAMQENAQDLDLSYLHDGKEYSTVQSGPSQEALVNFELQLSLKNVSEAVVVPPKAKKGHEKKAKKRPLPFNTKDKNTDVHSWLLEDDVPGPGLLGTREEVIAKVERVAVEAHNKILAEGEAVTVAKVVLELLRVSNNISFESLGLSIHDIPHLRQLAYLEERVNTLILCHLAARKITTLYDLHAEILKAEKVQDFQKLQIGHLSLHPLVVKHFAPFTGVNIYKITARDVLNHLWDYLDINTHQNTSKLQVDDFLLYMVKERSLSSSDHLYVRIQCLEMYTSYLVQEKKSLAKLLNSVLKLNGKTIKRTVQKKGFTKHYHSAQNNRIQHSKHVVYLSSDEEDIDNHNWGELAGKKKDSFTSDGPSDKRCSYPSAAEERLRLLGKVSSKLQQDLAECELSLQESLKLNGKTIKRTVQKKGLTKHYHSAQNNRIQHSKHVVYLSSDKEDIDNHNWGELAGKKEDSFTSDGPSDKRCSYPSAAEERLRLLGKVPSKLQQDLAECELSLQESQAIATAWIDVCSRFSIEEVLMQMVTESGDEQDMSKEKLLMFFHSHSATTILKIAVQCMKTGLWKSVFDTENVPVSNDVLNNDVTENTNKQIFLRSSAEQIDIEELGFSCTTKEQLVWSPEQVLEEVVMVLHEVLESIGSTLGIRRLGQDMPDWQSLCFMLKTILTLEKDVVDRLSVESFCKLKLGPYHKFIEMHLDKIMKDCTKMCKSTALSVMCGNGVSEARARTFVSQVRKAVGSGHVSFEFLMQLFARQFHLQVVSGWCSIIIQDLPDCLISKNASSCSFSFSLALLASQKDCRDYLNSDVINNKDTVELLTRPQMGLLGNISSVDARHCLLNAPMLSNLLKWSQWDSVFFPILGLFPDWLEKEGPAEGLACLVTLDGAYLRIDGSATLEKYLAAAVNGCGKEAALQFVSVVAAYGGVDRVSHDLLKLYSQQAVEVLVVKFHLESIPKTTATTEEPECPFSVQSGDHNAADNLKTWTDKDYMEKFMGPIQFVFDMLTCLPSEFVVVAASVVIPALVKIVPDVTTAMLNLNSSSEHLIKLHEIGLALGIVEWINNFSSLFVEPPASTANVSFDKTHFGVFGSKVTSCHEVFCGESLEELNNENRKHSYVESKSLTRWGVNAGAECKVDTATAEDLCCGAPDQTLCEKEAEEVIARIRKEEFGIDPGVPSKELGCPVKQRAQLGRTLRCLLQELYSEDLHFVLELVQNADDNRYPDGVEATLVFLLETQQVVVVNNELGFTSSNIQALCDIGSSTKNGSAAEHIGHKGIGFKSVFCVTDAPEVHSRGYHIKFDVSEGEGELGFILPTVVPAVSGSESVEKMLASEAFTEQMGTVWNTRIILPLKSTFVDSPCKQMLSSKFDDIHPSLLLFLRRLQKMIIKNDLTGTLRTLQKCHTHDGLIELSDGNNRAVWLVVKQPLDAVVDHLGKTNTELALALPLREVSSGLYAACCEHQPVFAFLPLRSYGLRFIVQGDFVLPASRGELDADSAWNQWLLSEVPMAFVKMIQTLKELDCFRRVPGKAADVMLSFVPLEGEAQGFFAPLPSMIFARLRASQCLPVDAKDSEWTFPCALLGGWTKFSRKFLSDGLLREHLGLHFLHRDVVMNPQKATALGVRIYGSRVLMNLMESLCSKKDALQALGPKWIGFWFAALSKCIVNEAELSSGFAQPKGEFEDIEKLKELSCIPLSNGVYTSLKEGPVWFPWTDGGSNMDNSRISQDKFPLVYSDLRSVHMLVLEPVDMESLDLCHKNLVEYEDNRILVSSMLKRLGVGQVSVHEVMMKHILPRMVSDVFLEKPDPYLVQYMAFVMVHLQSNCMLCKLNRSSIMLQLCEAAVVATKDGPRRASTTTLHFGSEFGCKVDVKEILEDLKVDWTEVHPTYLKAFQGSSQEELLSQWRQFFENLGVSDFVKVKRNIKKLHDKRDGILKRIPVEQCKEESSLSAEDWDCPELIQIIESLCNSYLDTSNKLKKLSDFVAAFDLHWDECYSKYPASYWSCSENEGSRVKTLPSFVVKLRSYAWVQSSVDRNLYKPTRLYYRCSAVESILGVHAPYAVPQLRSMKFIQALGLKVKVSVLDVLYLLKSWNRHSFETSLSQMAQLYSFLWKETVQRQKDIVAFFQQNASIFVPNKSPDSSHTCCKGRFYSVDHLIWKDDTGCLAKCSLSKNVSSDLSKMCPLIFPKTLDLLYPTLRGFLVDVCQVKHTMECGDYVNVLKFLAKQFSPSEVLTEALAVFSKWSHDIESKQMSSSSFCKLKEALYSKESPILPTTQNKWASLHSSAWLVCWCDDEVIGRQFSTSEKVLYVCVSTKPGKGLIEANNIPQIGQLLPFLKALDIFPLSKVVEREPTISGATWSKKMFDMLNWSFPYTQRYLQRWHKEIYEHLQQCSFDIQLKKIQCFHAERLSVRYKLPMIGLGTKNIEADYLLQGENFYGTTMEKLKSLYYEFSRIYFNGTPNMHLANFLRLITLAFQFGSSVAELEALLTTQGIGPCSDLGKEWLFELPSVDKSQVGTGSLKHSAEHHAKEKDSTAIQDNLSWDGAKNRADGRGDSSVVGNVTICSISLAAGLNQGGTEDSESKGEDIRSSSIAKDTPAVIEAYAEDVQADGRDAKLCERDPCNNDKVQGPGAITKFESTSSLAGLTLPRGVNLSSKDKILLGDPCGEQALLTGRLGEAIVFNHLMEKYGTNHVNWINAEMERGLPYDIVVEESDGLQLHVEVKATWSADKDWFEISSREWDFAVQAGERFIITRVFFNRLSGSARFVWFRNPAKLCQDKRVRLALIASS